MELEARREQIRQNVARMGYFYCHLTLLFCCFCYFPANDLLDIFVTIYLVVNRISLDTLVAVLLIVNRVSFLPKSVWTGDFPESIIENLEQGMNICKLQIMKNAFAC